jgi:hypothetical protein
LNFYLTKLFVVYVCSHFGIFLISDAIYWDDWTLVDVNDEVILDTMRQAGGFLNFPGYLHLGLSFFGPWIYKFLTFFMMFGAGIALDQIIKNYKSINSETRFVIVLFFLILPLYWSRVALINFFYTFCYFLFFLAWATNQRNRFLSMFLFFISFNTNSLLVFFIIPFFEIYYRNTVHFFSLKSIIKFALNRFELTLLPFIFFGAKVYFFSPYGLYEGHNEQYDITALFNSPYLMFNTWYGWFYHFRHIHIYVYTAVGITLFYTYILKGDLFKTTGFTNKLILTFLTGIFIFIIGGIPYWILDKMPSFFDWSSRHQILFPLGMSIILVVFVSLLSKKLKAAAIVSVISFSTIMNVTVYKDLYIDWQKQKMIMKLISKNDMIRNGDILLFEDQTKPLNAMLRQYRFYEWNGLVALAMGDENRFSVDRAQFPSFFNAPSFKLLYENRDKYKASNFNIYKQQVPIHIQINNVSNGPIDLMKEFAGIKLNIKIIKLPTITFN